MSSTQIILTENVPGLGAEADVVKVRRGYARNYLLPHGKAYEVTPASLRKLDSLKAKRAEREAREMNEAEDLARRINKLRVTFTLRNRRDRQGVWFDHRAGLVSESRTSWGTKLIVTKFRSSTRSRRPANMKCRSSCTTTWSRISNSR